MKFTQKREGKDKKVIGYIYEKDLKVDELAQKGDFVAWNNNQHDTNVHFASTQMPI